MNNFDPNQPRDDIGRWVRIGAGLPVLDKSIEDEIKEILGFSEDTIGVAEEDKMTRMDVIQDLYDNYVEWKEHGKLKKLRKYLIEIGEFRVITDEELSHGFISRGKLYEFIMDGVKYTWRGQ